MLVKKLSNERFELCGRIGLLKEAPAEDEPPGHVIGKRASRGVEHRQVGPEANRVIGDVVAAEWQCIETDIYEQGIDMVRGSKVQERSGKVARQQRVVAQILNHPFEALKNESIILYDKNDGHQRGIWLEFFIDVTRPVLLESFRCPSRNPRRRKRFRSLSFLAIDMQIRLVGR